MTKTIGDLFSGPGSNPIGVLLPTAILPVWDPSLGTKTGGALVSVAQTAMLTVTEANKNTQHGTFGLVDWILPKPTNTTGDYAALQASLNAAGAGSRLLAPQGTYLLNTIPGVPEGCEVHGAGDSPTTGTVFKMANAANLDAVIASVGWLTASTTPPVGVQTHYFDFCVDGNRTNQSSGAGHGLVVFNQGSKVERIQAKNCLGDGIRADSGTQAGFGLSTSCNEIKINNCTARNNGGTGIHFAEFNTTARLTDGFVRNCIVDGNSNGDYGIRIDGAAGHIVENNHVYACRKSSIRCDRAFGIRIADNYCEGYGFSTTVGTYYGIDCDTSPALDKAMITIKGNQVITPITNPATGTTLYGIGVQASSGATEICVEITGNILRGRTWTTPTTAIILHNAANTTTFNVREGNVIESTWDVPVLIGSLTGLNLVSVSTGETRWATTTFSATPTILPARVEAASGMWGMTLTGNVTAMTWTAGRDGQMATVIFTQDATGGRTVAWPASFVNPTAPTTTANAVTAQTFVYVAAISKWVHCQ